MRNSLSSIRGYLDGVLKKPTIKIIDEFEGDGMHFLNLIETLSKTITVDNIETVLALVEKLVALAEAMKQQPPVTPAQ